VQGAGPERDEPQQQQQQQQHKRVKTLAQMNEDAAPPTKASLKAWWNHFTFAQRARKDAEAHGHYAHPEGTSSALRRARRRERQRADFWPRVGCGCVEAHTVFGKPLRESLKFASVQISTANANGELYVWGYVPVVVAKWYVVGSSLRGTALDSRRSSISGLYLKENGGPHIMTCILQAVLG
jgi:GTPase-activating protein SAC7